MKPSAGQLTRCVAFLRGVNLGKRAVKGPELVKAFTAIGLKKPVPFLASGNVIFDHSQKNFELLGPKIESQLHRSLGFESRVFLRSVDEIAGVIESNPFQLDAKQRDAFTVNVMFLDQPASTAMKKRLVALRCDYDDLAFLKREVWWLCRGPKISDSTLFQGNRLEKAVDAPNTMRNIRTLQRLVVKDCAGNKFRI